MIRQECREMLASFCKEHNLPTPKLRFSNALKRCNGLYKYSFDKYQMMYAHTDQDIRSAINTYEIVISGLILQFFDKEQVKSTLIHEMTHHYCLFKKKNSDHNEFFKRKCAEFGGSMNSTMAGSTYADTATTNFVSRKVGFTLECGCGKTGHGRKSCIREPQKKSLNRYCCPVCRTSMSEWKRIYK